MQHRPILPSTPDEHATDKACVLLQIESSTTLLIVFDGPPTDPFGLG